MCEAHAAWETDITNVGSQSATETQRDATGGRFPSTDVMGFGRTRSSFLQESSEDRWCACVRWMRVLNF